MTPAQVEDHLDWLLKSKGLIEPAVLARIREMKSFINDAFEAHPNLDVDVDMVRRNRK